MNIEKLAIWFLGSFLGAAVSSWLGYHWLIGSSAGAAIGLCLTVRNEIRALIVKVFDLIIAAPANARAWWLQLVHDFKHEPIKRVQMLSGFYSGLIITGVMSWIFFPLMILMMLFPGNPGPSPFMCQLQPVVLSIASVLIIFIAPLLFALPGGHKKDPSRYKILRIFAKMKRWVKYLNILCAPVGAVLLIIMKIRRACRKHGIDLSWRALIIAAHSREAVTAAAFCFIGASIGGWYNSVFLGGFAGLGLGCLEAWLVKQFVLPKLVANA